MRHRKPANPGIAHVGRGKIATCCIHRTLTLTEQSEKPPAPPFIASKSMTITPPECFYERGIVVYAAQ